MDTLSIWLKIAVGTLFAVLILLFGRFMSRIQRNYEKRQDKRSPWALLRDELSPTTYRIFVALFIIAALVVALLRLVQFGS